MPARATVTQVDAFTDEPFSGNPAAVCRLDQAPSEAWMQALAAEMNLSETAFLVPDGDGHRLRWFTPTREVELCGHATLASAHALWEQGHLAKQEPAVFDTASGRLTATREEGRIWLDFPVEPAKEREPPEGLAQALGQDPVCVAESRLDLLVELADQAAVAATDPDLRALADLDDNRGVIVTAEAQDEAADYVCRYFAPAYGIDEDPVTGSIQCTLGPWWRQRLGQDRLDGRQLSARGGRFQVVPDGQRVRIGGKAVTVFEASLIHAPG